MKPGNDIRGLFQKAAVDTHPETDGMVLERVLAAHDTANADDPPLSGLNIRSRIMKNSITRLAAAAVVVATVGLCISLWNRSVPSAYAIEQTIEANRSVRYLHIKNFTTGHEEPREGWLEFGADGQVTRLRAHMPEWASPEDGPRVIVWKDGTVHVWLKRQNLLSVASADNMREQLSDILRELDPRLALAHMRGLERQGKVEIVIEEPPGKFGPIRMTVTYLAESESPDRRKVLSIDRTTKLINTIELYRLEDGEYRCEGRIELHEYNRLIDAERFDLANEVPANVTRIDLSATDLGLEQSQLGDEEVATAVVRQFFECLIAADYEAASRLLPLGAASLRRQFGAVKVLRIVSVGPATRGPGAETRELTVPCAVEIEEGGKRSTVTLSGVRVQPLGAQPNRWAIQTLGD